MAKILVVDDIEDMRDIIHHFLKEEGHDVVTVTSSCDAIAQLESHRYEILITDLLMPDVNGFELMQNVRRPGNKEYTPRIIAISGGVSGLGTDTILNAAAVKADAVIKKPFTKDELTSAVNKLLAA